MKKRNLYIISAGDFGRELEAWLERKEWLEGHGFSLTGFLHHGDCVFDRFPSGYKIVGDYEDFAFSPDDAVILGMADPNYKSRVYAMLNERVEIASFVSPDAIIGKFIRISVGSVICPGCIISSNISIGIGVTINMGTSIGHDVIIGDFCSLMPQVDVGGAVEIGPRVFIGTKAVIAPYKSVGEDARISSGSVVVNKVKPGITVFGNPATKLFSAQEKKED